MAKDCGCEKKDEPNRIWDYIKGYEPKPVVNPLTSYPGLNGFTYTTTNGTYVIFFNFSIIEGKIIKYFITLDKIEKIKNKKHKNTIITYLKCKKQFSHEFTVGESTIKNIISDISNGIFNSIPHDPFVFNNVIIDIIKQIEAKEGLSGAKEVLPESNVQVSQSPKSSARQGCGAKCSFSNGLKSCGSPCSKCASYTFGGAMYCR